MKKKVSLLVPALSLFCVIMLFSCSNTKQEPPKTIVKKDSVITPPDDDEKWTGPDYHLHPEITDTSLRRLVNELNYAIRMYGSPNPYGGNTSNPFSYFPPAVAKQYLKDNASEDDHTKIYNQDIIDYYYNQIMERMMPVLTHKHIAEYDLQKILEVEQLRSADGKLSIISFPENSAGTAHIDICFIQYKTADNKVYAYDSNLVRSGYDNIQTIKSGNNTQYLLHGGGKGCTTCFYEYVTLLEPSATGLHEVFNYNLSGRGFANDHIQFDSAKGILQVDYETDDYNTECLCEGSGINKKEHNPYDSTDKVEWGNLCKCIYVYNGRTFVFDKTKQHLKIRDWEH